MKKYLFISEWNKLYSRQKYIIEGLEENGLKIDKIFLEDTKKFGTNNYIYNIVSNSILLEKFLMSINIDLYEGIIVTYDFTYTLQKIIEKVQHRGIPSFLIFHEGVFFDISKWHRIENTILNNIFLGKKYLKGIPQSQNVFPWGKIHKNELLSRGYTGNIYQIGTDKFKKYSKLNINVKQVKRSLGITNDKKVILYVCQLFDIQINEKQGLSAQRKAINDLVEYAKKKQYNLIIRSVVGLDTPQYQQSHVYYDGIDGDYNVSGEENIIISDSVYGFNSTMLIEGLIAYKKVYSFKYIDYYSDFANSDYMYTIMSENDLYRKERAQSIKNDLSFLIGDTLEGNLKKISKKIKNTSKKYVITNNANISNYLNFKFLLFFLKDYLQKIYKGIL